MEKAAHVLRRAMRDDVYDAVLAMLLDGRLPADSPVSIDRLARSLEVSPTPVREALVELESTGLVRRIAHRGYLVAPLLTAQQTAELVDARLLVESTATAWASRLRHPDLLNELRAAYRAHEEAAWAVREWDGTTYDRNGLPSTLRPYFTADWHFHQVILDHCGNHFLRQMVGTLGASVQRMRQNARGGPSDADQAVAEHRRILIAIESADPQRAADAMRAHLEAVRERSIANA